MANRLAGVLPLSLGNLTALTYAFEMVEFVQRGEWGAACLKLVCTPRFSMLCCRRLEILNNDQPGYMLGGTIPTTISTLTNLRYAWPTSLVDRIE